MEHWPVQSRNHLPPTRRLQGNLYSRDTILTYPHLTHQVRRKVPLRAQLFDKSAVEHLSGISLSASLLPLEWGRILVLCINYLLSFHGMERVQNLQRR